MQCRSIPPHSGPFLPVPSLSFIPRSILFHSVSFSFPRHSLCFLPIRFHFLLFTGFRLFPSHSVSFEFSFLLILSPSVPFCLSVSQTIYFLPIQVHFISFLLIPIHLISFFFHFICLPSYSLLFLLAPFFIPFNFLHSRVRS